MFFTKVLGYYVRRKRVPGLLHIGKVKIIPRITLEDKRRAVSQMILERNNLELISRPYITQEEDNSDRSERQEAEDKSFLHEYRLSKMLKNRYTIDHLNHLNVEKKWE